MIKSYTELLTIPDFYDRIKYLSTGNHVGEQTFGGGRYLNQALYQSYHWKKAKRECIIRDEGMDLAHPDFPIAGTVFIHHINPITIDDILERRDIVFDLENLISTSMRTHQAIHYGDGSIFKENYKPRTPHDTCLWR